VEELFLFIPQAAPLPAPAGVKNAQRGTLASPSASAPLRPPPRRASHAKARPFSPIPLLFRLHSGFVPAPTAEKMRLGGW
jgi:hypothetical protein